MGFILSGWHDGSQIYEASGSVVPVSGSPMTIAGCK
jgi:hypothetical protein